MWCRSSIRRRRPSRIPAASNSSNRKAAASITAGRAETWRPTTRRSVASHRAEIRAETDKLGWSFTIHRTDRTATELMLALHARMGAPPAAPPTVSGRHARRRSGGRRMLGLPLGFAQPLVLLGLLSLPVLWWLLRLDSAAPAPHRLSADAAAVRHSAQGRARRRARRGG